MATTREHKIKELRKRSKLINHFGDHLETRADSKIEISDDGRTIKGYGIVWGVRDTYGTIFIKGCCAKSIQERGPGSNSKQKILMLWMHDTRDPIGQFTVLKEDDYGLYFEAVLDEGVDSADRALIQTRSGTVNQFSAGFNYIWDKVEWEDKTESLLLREIILFEVSPVSFASNEETYCIRSAEDFEMQNDYLRAETEHFIRALPAAKQLEARQLFTRTASLAALKPEAERSASLRGNNEPKNKGIDYKYLTDNLKL